MEVQQADKAIKQLSINPFWNQPSASVVVITGGALFIAGTLHRRHRVVNRILSIDAQCGAGYGLGMENELRVSVAMPKSLMLRIDAWRESMVVKPARSTAIRALVEMALANVAASKAPPRGGRRTP